MGRLIVVVVALVALVGLPMRSAMGEMTGMATDVGADQTADVRCTVDCSSLPPAGICLTMCLAVVALLSVVAGARRSLAGIRLRVPRSLFEDQLTGSSVFRPPRLA